MELKNLIRTVPNFPRPGMHFRDITTLMRDPQAFAAATEALCQPFVNKEIDAVVGIEARGFILAGAMAQRLGKGFVPIRKGGKLPPDTYRESFTQEFGEEAVELAKSALKPGAKVLLVDDTVATGGTAMAALELLEQAQAEVVATVFLIDLNDLGGAERLRAAGHEPFSLVSFPSGNTEPLPKPPKA